MSPKAVVEWSGATTEFPKYDMTQLLRHSRGRTPSQPSRRPEVPETAVEQDKIVRAIAEIELEQLEAQGGGGERDRPF
jgi:hypothetical protein